MKSSSAILQGLIRAEFNIQHRLVYEILEDEEDGQSHSHVDALRVTSATSVPEPRQRSLWIPVLPLDLLDSLFWGCYTFFSGISLV